MLCGIKNSFLPHTRLYGVRRAFAELCLKKLFPSPVVPYIAPKKSKSFIFFDVLHFLPKWMELLFTIFSEQALYDCISEMNCLTGFPHQQHITRVGEKDELATKPRGKEKEIAGCLAEGKEAPGLFRMGGGTKEKRGGREEGTFGGTRTDFVQRPAAAIQ